MSSYNVLTKIYEIIIAYAVQSGIVIIARMLVKEHICEARPTSRSNFAENITVLLATGAATTIDITTSRFPTIPQRRKAVIITSGVRISFTSDSRYRFLSLNSVLKFAF